MYIHVCVWMFETSSHACGLMCQGLFPTLIQKLANCSRDQMKYEQKIRFKTAVAHIHTRNERHWTTATRRRPSSNKPNESFIWRIFFSRSVLFVCLYLFVRAYEFVAYFIWYTQFNIQSCLLQWQLVQMQVYTVHLDSFYLPLSRSLFFAPFHLESGSSFTQFLFKVFHLLLLLCNNRWISVAAQKPHQSELWFYVPPLPPPPLHKNHWNHLLYMRPTLSTGTIRWTQWRWCERFRENVFYRRFMLSFPNILMWPYTCNAAKANRLSF